MITLFLSPLSITCSLQSHHQFLETHSTKTSLYTLKHPNSSNDANVLRAPRSSNSKDKSSDFLDNNGEIDDMDGYLNNLSLEYDSVWDTKPSWCQPWTITLTGVLAITGSWLVLHSVVVTALVIALISAWWYIFLYSYPKVYSDMIAERRKKVTRGVEDTYGVRKSQ